MSAIGEQVYLGDFISHVGKVNFPRNPNCNSKKASLDVGNSVCSVDRFLVNRLAASHASPLETGRQNWSKHLDRPTFKRIITSLK